MIKIYAKIITSLETIDFTWFIDNVITEWNNMEKSNYKEWSVNFNGRIIKVSNWWNWEMKGSADLYLDDKHLDHNTDMLANPNKFFSKK